MFKLLGITGLFAAFSYFINLHIILILVFSLYPLFYPVFSLCLTIYFINNLFSCILLKLIFIFPKILCSIMN